MTTLTVAEVPREPTEMMIDAAFRIGGTRDDWTWPEIWRAMWDAAQPLVGFAPNYAQPTTDVAGLCARLRHGDHDYQEATIHAWMNEAAALIEQQQREIAERDEIIERLNKRRDEWFEAFRTAKAEAAVLRELLRKVYVSLMGDLEMGEIIRDIDAALAKEEKGGVAGSGR